MARKNRSSAHRSASSTGRPFGWAGWLTTIPDAWRLIRVDGDSRRGKLGLGDGEAVRLQLAWASVTRRRFNPERFARRHLRRSIRPRRARRAAEFELIDNARLQPLIRYRDDEHQLDRYVGYAPDTRRVMDIVCHRTHKRADRFARDITIADLTDQPDDKPVRWAFFAVSFTAPERFRHDSATLNLGDMRVRLVRRAGLIRNEYLTVRHIYPAELAMMRGDLDYWLDNTVTEMRQLYRPQRVRWFRRKAVPADVVDTTLGTCRATELRLRYLLRFMLWRYPWRLRALLIHDEQHDRLVLLQLAARPQRMDDLIEQVIDGLCWTDDDHWVT